MKNIFKISALSCLLLLVSCSEEHFDVEPNYLDNPNSVTQSESSFRSLTDGAYDAMKNIFDGDNGNALILADVLADNLILNPQGRLTNTSQYQWSYNGTSGGATALFSDSYFAISRANFVLDNLNKIPYTAFMKNIEAEAKAIRGAMHFEVLRAYSKIPTQDGSASTSMGIPYITVFDPFQKPSRDATVTDSYNKVIADLLFAYNNINTSNGSIGRFNKTSVAALLNRVYLYMGDYANAITYGEYVITNSSSVGARTNFAGIWTDANTDGVLLSLLNGNVNTDNMTVGVCYNQNASGIRSEYNVNYDLFLKYSPTGISDIRKTGYLLTANYAGTPYNHIIKYRTRTGSSTAQVVNVKFIRTAEVYLNTAEAYMKSSTPNAGRALQLLNILRGQRYSPYTPGTETGTALLNAIYSERRLELAFENDRFWTLKRLGLPVNRSAFGPNVDGTGTGPGASIVNLQSSDYRWQLPIPQSEINLNPNMKQNPGY
ncbi:RagB/SusD family nutrient uptake outer membrane protein [Chryseobacterium nepalense]|jgi:hypothetical protein|uniref:RagB/SusD family nutrient uptake outer membrane protein n=1 Tax=Chryseobacterium nepalense TaxID=1854498 RepID=A0ABY4K2B9_9FLAO|nr:RagB/SusD family nutrient uptake outer membrane protein [Chryseobacterium nepalense]UPQ74941.1 RagB/SusD family nutrient uptake outer membrane protein [Chryseobacterium nepalense]